MGFSRLQLTDGSVNAGNETSRCPFGAPVRLFLAILSGILLALLFPKPGLFWLAPVALVPLLAVIATTRPRAAFGYAWLAGFVFFLGLLYWIALFGYAPWIVLSAWMALFVGLFGGLTAIALRGRQGWAKILLPAAIWTAMEWLRSLGPAGFTWGTLACSQTPFLPLIQISSVTGPYGVSFILVMVNAAFTRYLLAVFTPTAGDSEQQLKRDFRRFAWTVLVVIATSIAGYRVMTVTTGDYGKSRKQPDMAIIQGNRLEERETIWTPTLVQDTMGTYLRLSKQAVENSRKYASPAARSGGISLLIWPETAVPTFLLENPDIRCQIESFAKKYRVWMLVGGSKHDRDNRILNTQFMFSPEGKLIGSYSKVHLVPLGEYVPWRQYIGNFLARWGIRDYDYAPGPGFNTLPSPGGKLGVSICFESIFPQISRICSRKGAELLVVVTNDAWFSRTAAAEQHAQMAVFRAVENRKWVARAATSGISMFISPTGVVTDSTRLFEERIITMRMIPHRSLSIYTRIGDLFAILCALAGIRAVLRRNR